MPVSPAFAGGRRYGRCYDRPSPGSSSARLECTVRDREVASSNLAFPTMRLLRGPPLPVHLHRLIPEGKDQWHDDAHVVAEMQVRTRKRRTDQAAETHDPGEAACGIERRIHAVDEEQVEMFYLVQAGKHE